MDSALLALLLRVRGKYSGVNSFVTVRAKKNACPRIRRCQSLSGFTVHIILMSAQYALPLGSTRPAAQCYIYLKRDALLLLVLSDLGNNLPLGDERQIRDVAVFLAIDDPVDFLERHAFRLDPIPRYEADDHHVPRAVDHIRLPPNSHKCEGEGEHRPEPVKEISASVSVL